MIKNDDREHPAHVKFISYSGKWPTLCSGILVLDICGCRVSFGDQDEYAQTLPDGSRPMHPKFWSSGGECRCPPGEIIQGEWNVDVSLLPDQYKEFAEEIDAVMNANIEHGCCGGCR